MQYKRAYKQAIIRLKYLSKDVLLLKEGHEPKHHLILIFPSTAVHLHIQLCW